MASSATFPVSSNRVVTSKTWHGRCSKVCSNAGPKWRVWESSPHNKILGQPLDLDAALPVLRVPFWISILIVFFKISNSRCDVLSITNDAYMLSEVSMPAGHRVCNRVRMLSRSSWNNGWILKDKFLIGATITRCDAGTMFWRAFKKSSFSTLMRNQYVVLLNV